jgi:ERCC4-type nuclease
MKIIIDYREKELMSLCNNILEQSNNSELKSKNNNKNIQICSDNLTLGDIVILNDKDIPMIIVERKTLSDLAASIKDGRYEEQSFRLNENEMHNHNIIYLVEGDWNAYKRTFYHKTMPVKTLVSSMISISYYKGFSLYRTNNIQETSEFIIQLADKLERETSKKKSFYTNYEKKTITTATCNDSELLKPDIEIEIKTKNETKEYIENKEDTNYCNVMKKTKKDNITPNNIGEIILSQIPNISTQSAIAIMNKFKTIKNLIYSLEKDSTCLDDIIIIGTTNKSRKINKNVKENIIKYLLNQE